MKHFSCDLKLPDQIAAAARGVLAALDAHAPVGRVLLVNNGGVGGFGRFPAPAGDRQLEIIDVNVRAVVDLTARLLPCLRRRGGAIINVASVLAHVPTPFCATYGASKAFLLNWSVALAEELRGTGVRVLTLSPGTTRTDFFTGSGAATPGAIVRRGMSPDDVARSAFDALATGKSSVVPGFRNRLTVAAASVLPRVAAARLARIVMEPRLPASS